MFPSPNFVENFKISKYKIISVKAAKVLLEYTLLQRKYSSGAHSNWTQTKIEESD